MTKKEKNQAELEIEALAEVFNIATTGFEKFYEETKDKSKGDYSTAVSSGHYSMAASSGASSRAVSSGASSMAVSSGACSKAVSSGDCSTAVSSGDSSKTVSSGECSRAVSSGDYSMAASSNNYSMAVSSGHSSKAVSSGDYSKAVSSGECSKVASSGHTSTAVSSGYSSMAVSSGDCSKAVSSGACSAAASSGDSSMAVSSGDCSMAVSSGYSSMAVSSGHYSGCAAVGYQAAVKGDKGNLIMASEYVIKDNKYIPIGGKADIIDGKKLKPGCWYIVESGKWVEVDFMDNVFSRVISNKSGVKKVRTENGKVLYVVSDDKGNSAHGETIKQAREDLIYKAIAEFDGKVPKSATGKEWVGIYRAMTGACAAGVKCFVDSTRKSLDGTYTAEEIAKLVKGQYGSEKFVEKIKLLKNFIENQPSNYRGN